MGLNQTVRDSEGFCIRCHLPQYRLAHGDDAQNPNHCSTQNYTPDNTTIRISRLIHCDQTSSSSRSEEKFISKVNLAGRRFSCAVLFLATAVGRPQHACRHSFKVRAIFVYLCDHYIRVDGVSSVRGITGGRCTSLVPELF